MNNELIERIDAAINTLWGADSYPIRMAANVLQDCKAALTQQLEVEPIAWMYVGIGSNRKHFAEKKIDDHGHEGWDEFPLFRHPPKTAAQPAQQGEVPEGFKQCPISGRPFWGNIEHPKLGLVATYGGPFDTYTIPAMGEDGELRCERFDQDEGAWVEGGEPFGWFYEDQQAERPPKTAAQPEIMQNMLDSKPLGAEFARAMMKDTASLYAYDETRTAVPLAGVPDAIPMRPYQTISTESPSYKAGWNACRKAMLYAAKEEWR